MFITLIVVTLSLIFACVQINQIVHIKYVHFFLYQVYLNKVVHNISMAKMTCLTRLWKETLRNK